jgi:hypothetical protein
MKKDSFQRVVFIIFAICAVLNQLLDTVPWFKYTVLAGSVLYLALG